MPPAPSPRRRASRGSKPDAARPPPSWSRERTGRQAAGCARDASLLRASPRRPRVDKRTRPPRRAPAAGRQGAAGAPRRVPSHRSPGAKPRGRLAITGERESLKQGRVKPPRPLPLSLPLASARRAWPATRLDRAGTLHALPPPKRREPRWLGNGTPKQQPRGQAGDRLANDGTRHTCSAPPPPDNNTTSARRHGLAGRQRAPREPSRRSPQPRAAPRSSPRATPSARASSATRSRVTRTTPPPPRAHRGAAHKSRLKETFHDMGTDGALARQRPVARGAARRAPAQTRSAVPLGTSPTAERAALGQDNVSLMRTRRARLLAAAVCRCAAKVGAGIRARRVDVVILGKVTHGGDGL